METLGLDLRYALRLLAKSKAFTAVAVLSLGLGIGANTAIFSLVNALLLRPLPVDRPQEMATVYTSDFSGDVHGTSSYPDYLDFKAGNDAFAGLAAYSVSPVNLGTGAESQVILADMVSGDYFPVLGLKPALGRPLSLDDDRAGAEPVVVISEGLWQRALGGDPKALLRPLRVNGIPFTVVGVAPAGYSGLLRGLAVDAWVPLSTLPRIRPGSDDLTSRGGRSLFLIGRLKPGLDAAQAASRFTTLAARLHEAHPRSWSNALSKGRTISVLPEHASRILPQASLPVTGFMALLLAVVGLVLLLACVNLAGLLLSRAAARRREIGVRTALGASRRRLVRQLLTESLMLSLLGGLVGVVFAAWGMDLLMALKPPVPVPVLLSLQLDSRVLAFTLLISVLAGVLFGLAPALAASRADILPALRDLDGSGPVRASRVRAVLVTSQVALSVLLLVGSGLFLRSLRNAQAIDPGFEAANLALVTFDASLGGHTEENGRALFHSVRERVLALPGVETVTLASTMPLGLGGGRRRAWIEGHSEERGEDMEIAFASVSAGYFDTLRIPVMRGRAILESDDHGTSPVVMVNEAFAARYWPGQDALGKRISMSGTEGPFMEVVGVARTGRYFTLGEQPRPYVYLPLAQNHEGFVTLVARTRGEPSSQLGALKAEVLGVSPNLPVFETKTMSAHLGLTLLPARLAGSVLGSFGLVALVLAALGLYGVMSYAVSQRTREMGIRMAIGAARSDVLRLLVGNGMKLAGAGIVLGLLAAAGAAPFLGSFVYGLSPTDPLSFLGASCALVVVALMACAIPARRAARIDPMSALRQD